MPLQEFALDPTGTNRIQIYYGDSGGSYTILLNNNIIGSITNQEELMAGRTFTLGDGSVLAVRLMNNQFQVMRNGQFLRPMSVAEIAGAQALVAEEGKKPSGSVPYPPQGAYPPQQPSGAMLYPPQGAYPPQQPSAAVPYPPQGAYPPQYPNMAPSANIVQRNSRAQSAMLTGFISIALSLLTLVTQVGFAGIITGTFAIVYGFMGLSASGRLANNAGRGQAITGIVLGFAGWLIVIISLIARSAIHGT